MGNRSAWTAHFERNQTNYNYRKYAVELYTNKNYKLIRRIFTPPWCLNMLTQQVFSLLFIIVSFVIDILQNTLKHGYTNTLIMN